jgi:hypothetical protein
MSQSFTISTSFRPLFNTALHDYAKKTGTKLDDHPLAKHLENLQIATGHCFDASYSTHFRPSADGHTDCPHCGEPYTTTHVLDDGNCYVIECQEGNLTDTLAHGFTYFNGGIKLATFLHINQVFLCPLDPVPREIPPEPDL